ncbi:MULTISPECIES: hypothetical protein [unclassified Thiocapsa]|uniref:hypothetical protein n=1 Tax=unclassified Thiocapsa TaxID=2641286 RepID=UPI0035B23422
MAQLELATEENLVWLRAQGYRYPHAKRKPVEYRTLPGPRFLIRQAHSSQLGMHLTETRSARRQVLAFSLRSVSP